MIVTDNKNSKEKDVAVHNDDSDLHNDELGENTGEDTGLAKAAKEDREKKKDSSNKVKGPKKENL